MTAKVGKPWVVANWKLNKTIADALLWIDTVGAGITGASVACDVGVAPVYTALWPVAQRVRQLNLSMQICAQEVFYELHGAFTGAVSAPLLQDAGCSWALVGHSERRQIFGETLLSSQKRVQAALQADLGVLLCVGETLKERDTGQTMAVIKGQLDAGLLGVDSAKMKHVAIAYEPVWAIGTGRVATPQVAQDTHAAVRAHLTAQYGQEAQVMRILYGGSVKSENAHDLMQQHDINGLLVGGASLDATAFLEIVKAAAS